MTTRHMSNRLDALEQRNPPAITHWHWVIGKSGESHHQARTRYEQEQGPIGANEGAVIWRVIG